MEIPDREWQECLSERDSLRARAAELDSLRDVACALSLDLSLRPLLLLIVDSAADVLDATAAVLFVHDKGRHELAPIAMAGGSGTELEERRISDDSGVAGWVIANELPLIVNDPRRDPRHRQDLAGPRPSPSSILAVPLKARGSHIGVLEVRDKRRGAEFTGEDLDLLSAFAAQAAIAIENERLAVDLRSERDRLLDAEELVRRKLQGELHDGLTQSLSSMAMKVNVIARSLPRDPDRAGAELAVLEADLRSAIGVVRSVLFDLRPLVLETQGLVAALVAWVDRIRATTVAALHLDTAGFSGGLGRDVEAAAFATVQESVNNILKHAQARNIWITLAGTPDDLMVAVRDDGRGFDPAAVGDRYEQRGSYGLLNMRERAAYVGGKLELVSTPGSGTVVTLVVRGKAERHNGPP